MPKKQSISNLRIPKKHRYVKKQTDAEKEVKKSTEDYRKLITGIKNVEYNPGKIRKTDTHVKGHFTKVPNSAIWRSDLTHTEFHLYAVLLSHRFYKTFSEIGQRLICKESKIDRHNIDFYLKVLETKKYIKIEKGLNKRWIYHFLKLS